MLHNRDERGFTLVEVAIILMTLAILSAILIPNIGAFNRLARFIKVKEDLQVICTAMKMYLDDTGESAFYIDGSQAGVAAVPDRDEQPTIGMLVGDGDIPDEGVKSSLVTPDDPWRKGVGSPTFQVEPDGGGTAMEFTVDTFANHLIQNEPGYRIPDELEDGDPSYNANGLQFDPAAGGGFNSLFAWRGPYINDRVYPDPWGNRYASNVFALYTPNQEGSTGYNSAVVCYSAGPDEQVDTEFNQPSGWFTGDDDQTVILHAGGW